MAAQRFLPDENGMLQVPKDRLISMRIPGSLIPKTPEEEAICPRQIEDRSICIDGDVGEVLAEMERLKENGAAGTDNS